MMKSIFRCTNFIIGCTLVASVAIALLLVHVLNVLPSIPQAKAVTLHREHYLTFDEIVQVYSLTDTVTLHVAAKLMLDGNMTYSQTQIHTFAITALSSPTATGQFNGGFIFDYPDSALGAQEWIKAWWTGDLYIVTADGAQPVEQIEVRELEATERDIEGYWLSGVLGYELYLPIVSRTRQM